MKNLKIPDYCIIIGGGKSIEVYYNKIYNLLYNKFVVTINYSFLHFPHTFLTFVDRSFYFGNNVTHPDISDLLKKEPLIIGHEGILDRKKYFPNTILLKGSNSFLKNPINGFYTPSLSGIWTLHLVLWLLDYKGTVFLLGYDWGGDSKNNTHYYSDIKHRGIGYIEYYKTVKADEKLLPFKNIETVKIYNVIANPESRITIFTKISYSYFINIINNLTNINQEEIRISIVNKIKKL